LITCLKFSKAVQFWALYLPVNRLALGTECAVMSLDRSLKGKSTLERHRNVLKRAERIVLLEDNDKWTEGKSGIYNLPKVAHRKAVAAKKPAKAEAGEAGATVAAAGAAKAGAATAAPAAPAAKAKK
jgi:small basic protein (TIGR04137 family)